MRSRKKTAVALLVCVMSVLCMAGKVCAAPSISGLHENKKEVTISPESTDGTNTASLLSQVGIYTNEAISDQYKIKDKDGNTVKEFEYEKKDGIVSEETSKTVRYLLEKVVSEGTGKNAYIEGYEIGGKTATSQTLPRSENKYISSFIGFAPAENPKVLAIAIINNPQGVYYGGTIAAPVVRKIYENILPYLEIEMNTKGDSDS